MPSHLERRRRELDAWLSLRGLTHTLSLAAYLTQRRVRQLIAGRSPGRVLDAGSGRGPHRQALERRGCDVIALDVEDRGGADLIGDLQAMPEVATASMDGVVCTQVLEHLPRPWDAVAEISRVLRPGGWLILSAPHLSPIHEAPHDYYRYTCFALRRLLAERGLEVLDVDPAGGLLAFLAHGASAVWLSLAGGLPLLRRPAWALNYLFGVLLLAPLDRWFGLRAIYPANYVVLAVKRAAAGGAGSESRRSRPGSRAE
jgi:SAM-dependent methyltransferase